MSPSATPTLNPIRPPERVPLLSDSDKPLLPRVLAYSLNTVTLPAPASGTSPVSWEQKKMVVVWLRLSPKRYDNGPVMLFVPKTKPFRAENEGVVTKYNAKSVGDPPPPTAHAPPVVLPGGGPTTFRQTLPNPSEYDAGSKQVVYSSKPFCTDSGNMSPRCRHVCSCGVGCCCVGCC